MSAKSRKRNKRLLALAALMGGVGMMGRGKKKFGTDAGFLKSAAAGGARLSTPPIHGTDHIPVAPKVVAPEKVITGLQEGNTRLKRDGMGPMESVIAKRKIPGYGTAVAPPGILNPYRAPRGPGPRRFSKGGSVKKAKVTGIAKRGFGRALMKGKK